jgi:hypothetical protein
MPKAIDPDKRAAIEQAIRDGAGQVSRNAIAEAHGVAASTVGKIANQAGLTAAFDRAQTKNATRARTADMAAERAALKALLLAEARDLLADLHRPCTVYNFGGAENLFNSEELTKPTPIEKKLIITSAAIALDKHIAIEKLDAADDGAEQAVSVIENIMGALRGQGPGVGDSL